MIETLMIEDLNLAANPQSEIRNRFPTPHPAFASLTSALSHKGRGKHLPHIR
jgi:hypothetical protein